MTAAELNPDKIQLIQGFYRAEIGDHVAYKALAERERDARLREVLARSSRMELLHSDFWKGYLETRGAPVPKLRGGTVKLALLRFMQRFLNPVLLVAALELGESRALRSYYSGLSTLGLDEDEKRTLRRIIFEEIEHEVTFRRESQKLGLENVRDFVLGMLDGLVEVLGVATGLSAVYASKPVLVATGGLIVGVAGALSMAVGAFISVRSQRQVNRGIRERTEVLFDVAPERAVGEYEQKLVDSGIPPETAAEVAARVGTNRDAISKLLLAGSDENELRSALHTGAAYLVGAAFPLVPYFFATSAYTALGWSVGFAALALASVASVISIFSGISLRGKVVEMVTGGLAAAGMSFAFGKVLEHFVGVSG